MKKICLKCGIEKNISCFYKDKIKLDGLRCWCGECVKQEIEKWQKNNPEKVRESNRKWRENNPEYHKEWHKRNPDKVRKITNRYIKQRRANDPKYKLNSNMATAIYHALKGNKAGRRWEDLVGYTLEKLRQRLELNFDENMSWQNYGSYWSVDHWKPRSLFNFMTAEDKEFKECWALENLQPLEKIANIKKSNRYEKLWNRHKRIS